MPLNKMASWALFEAWCCHSSPKHKITRSRVIEFFPISSVCSLKGELNYKKPHKTKPKQKQRQKTHSFSEHNISGLFYKLTISKYSDSLVIKYAATQLDFVTYSELKHLSYEMIFISSIALFLQRTCEIFVYITLLNESLKSCTNSLQNRLNILPFILKKK